jgi:nucleoside-diphosphate-sugar epimerase
MQVTVLGASGGIGNAITRELHARGHGVTAVNRRGDADVPAGVRQAAADADDLAAMTRACAGADVVVMAAQPPYDRWAERWPHMLEVLLAACESAGARLVFVDNLYMHAPAEGPITEASPEHATTPKGRVRAALGRQLLAAHDAGRVRVAIGRFSDYYGPRGPNSFVSMLMLVPGLAGKTMRTFLRDDVPHTFHYLPDAARGFAALVESEAADGRAWVLPAAPALTQGEVAALVNELLPRPVRVSRVSRPLLALGALFSGDLREAKQVTEQFDRPWVVDAAAFTAAFGPIALTEHRTALAETLAWMRGEVPAAGDPTAPDRQPMTPPTSVPSP